MIDAIIAGFENVATWQVVLALIFGALCGIVVGALPGLEPAGAMAILLPFSLQLEPLAGITLLLGTYGGSWYGGSIPAILIRVPGDPVHVLTTYDGYPMARRGEAHRALSLAYSSSFIGGTVSVLALIFLAPYLAKVAARFGAPEYAMIAVVALVSVILAHQKQVLAALVSLGLGMFLGTVGFESLFNTQRYTFGQQWLLGGIPMVPVVIGMFAMSQAFVLLETKSHRAGSGDLVYRNRFRGLIEAFRYPKTLARSCGLGVVMGLLPGVGEFGAQFLSYSLARRFSKTPEQFGKGAPEGLVAAESSISACTSTVLVPLLSLGVPVDPLMAMVLAVFMIHNIIPGPQLFVEHPDFITGLYISLLLLNVFVLCFLLFATKYVERLTRISPRMIGAVILVLALIGTYTQNYRLTDALITVIFALVGRFFIRNGIPGFPLVIGLVLGPMFEMRVMQSLSLSNGDPTIFLTRPVSAGLLALALTGVALFAVSQWRGRAAATNTDKAKALRDATN
ncbi:tripartite tricarboxylate transporter permease [Mesorhizobium sp. LHD-90]|uniref:tripartite tricarboxylate transporter permease n=1 Tax=Mesorhizobium sp. LHD-90 TaxID=3071414 RepID=UPI0027E1DBB7|nr:tripartite tricarboxylate transporter permease [Mesorhizobium sp. LHD-90]MDQ6437494.1 tripartite tricarboxylate transporter permease [Mesorhizobium sp. LHD-90]